MKRFLLTCSIVAVCLWFAAVCLGQPRPQQKRVPPGESLKRFLKAYVQPWDDDQTTRYIAAFTDLNGDGIPEAIVYLLSEGLWCGSGGCQMLVLQAAANSWKIITAVSITRPPIRVLSAKSNGWNHLAVWVQGGGILQGYESELKFDGRTYPENPTVPPARKSSENAPGRTLIRSYEEAVPLY